MRVRAPYQPTDITRLHASERIAAFPEDMWSYFIGSLTQEDIRLYPNVDLAYLHLGRLTGIDTRYLLLGEGADRILKDIIDCYRGHVITTDPCFPMYRVYAQLTASKISVVPWDKLEELSGVITTGSLVVLSNPLSPVGISIDMFSILELCAQRGATLVVDETYIEFSDCRSMVDMVDRYPVIVVRSLSKSHGSAGARIGYSVAAPAVRDKLSQWSAMNEISGVSVKWLETLCRYKNEAVTYAARVRHNRSLLEAHLESLAITYIPSSTNYVNVLGHWQFTDVVVKYANISGVEYTRISIPSDNPLIRKIINEIN